MTKPKARLVARGFSQKYEDKFDQTFAATPAAANTKTIAVVGVERGWVIYQLDLRQAYIRVDIDFQVFIKLPEGCGNKSEKGSAIEQRSLWSPSGGLSLVKAFCRSTDRPRWYGAM